MMEKESRVRAKTILKREDIKKAIKNKNIKDFDRMLNIPIYAYRIKKALYDNNKLSARGVMLNNDIYSLRLGKKDNKGIIYIENCLMPIFDRYKLTNELVEKGDTLSAFIIEHDDVFYNHFHKNKHSSKGNSEDELVAHFSDAYNRISALIMYEDVDKFLNSDTELSTAYKKHLEKSVGKIINTKIKTDMGSIAEEPKVEESPVIDINLEKLMNKIAKTSEEMIKENLNFNEKENKQAAKRARILSNKLTHLLKLYRKESVKVVKTL